MRINTAKESRSLHLHYEVRRHSDMILRKNACERLKTFLGSNPHFSILLITFQVVPKCLANQSIKLKQQRNSATQKTIYFGLQFERIRSFMAKDTWQQERQGIGSMWLRLFMFLYFQKDFYHFFNCINKSRLSWISGAGVKCLGAKVTDNYNPLDMGTESRSYAGTI